MTKPQKLTWNDLPESERKRLIARETAQRSETKRRGLPVEHVSVEALWMLQGGVCGCDDRCGPLDPLAPHGEPAHIVIGHQYARSLRGGHTIKNVRLQRADCNHAAASVEKTAKAKRDKFAVDLIKPESKPKSGKIQSRGFQKRPDGHTYNWPKRKVGT